MSVPDGKKRLGDRICTAIHSGIHLAIHLAISGWRESWNLMNSWNIYYIYHDYIVGYITVITCYNYHSNNGNNEIWEPASWKEICCHIETMAQSFTAKPHHGCCPPHPYGPGNFGVVGIVIHCQLGLNRIWMSTRLFDVHRSAISQLDSCIPGYPKKINMEWVFPMDHPSLKFGFFFRWDESIFLEIGHHRWRRWHQIVERQQGKCLRQPPDQRPTNFRSSSTKGIDPGVVHLW